MKTRTHWYEHSLEIVVLLWLQVVITSPLFLPSSSSVLHLVFFGYHMKNIWIWIWHKQNNKKWMTCLPFEMLCPATRWLFNTTRSEDREEKNISYEIREAPIYLTASYPITLRKVVGALWQCWCSVRNFGGTRSCFVFFCCLGFSILLLRSATSLLFHILFRWWMAQHHTGKRKTLMGFR